MQQHPKYLITSKAGMTPFYRTNSKREAVKASNEAKRQGLDGEIIIVDRDPAEKHWQQMERDIARLIVALKKDIHDGYRATDDPDDNTPGMCVTFGTNDGVEWSYQTGDNSYTGSCYGKRHWGVVYIHRRSNSKEVAKDAVDQMAEAMSSATH